MLFGDFYSDDPEVIEKPSITWIPSYSGEIGAGYSDNPLYGPYLREEASFLETSVEAFYLAQSKPENFTYFYFFGEGKAFEDLTENKTSGILLGHHNVQRARHGGACRRAGHARDVGRCAFATLRFLLSTCQVVNHAQRRLCYD